MQLQALHSFGFTKVKVNPYITNLLPAIVVKSTLSIHPLVSPGEEYLHVVTEASAPVPVATPSTSTSALGAGGGGHCHRDAKEGL